MRWVAVLVVSAVGVALGAVGSVLLRDDGPVSCCPTSTRPRLRARDRRGGGQLPARLRLGGRQRRAGPAPDRGREAGSGNARHDRPPARPAHRRLARARSLGPASFATRDRRATTTGTSLGFEVYELRSALKGKPVGPSEMTGFCLGDRYETERASVPRASPSGPVWTDECGRDQPALLILREGSRPGTATTTAQGSTTSSST